MNNPEEQSAKMAKESVEIAHELQQAVLPVFTKHKDKPEQALNAMMLVHMRAIQACVKQHQWDDMAKAQAMKLVMAMKARFLPGGPEHHPN